MLTLKLKTDMTENQERAEQARSAFTVNGGNVQILPNATIYEARLCACPDTVTLCQTVLTDLYNEILADYSSPLKLVKSRAFISALLPHLTFVNGANVPSIRYGIRKYVLGEGMR